MKVSYIHIPTVADYLISNIIFMYAASDPCRSWFSTRKVALWVVLWGAATCLAIGVPLATETVRAGWDPATRVCGVHSPALAGSAVAAAATSDLAIYTVCTTFLLFTGPLMGSVVCYTKICVRMVGAQKAIRQLTVIKSSHSVNLYVSYVTVLCWTPLLLWNTYDPRHTRLPPWTHRVALCCVLLSTALDPLFYAFRTPEFRRRARNNTSQFESRFSTIRRGSYTSAWPGGDSIDDPTQTHTTQGEG